MASIRRAFTDEFKAEAVRLVTTVEGHSARQVARDLGIHESLLRRWQRNSPTKFYQHYFSQPPGGLAFPHGCFLSKHSKSYTLPEYLEVFFVRRLRLSTGLRSRMIA
jgi:hypothetical protein